MTPVVSQRPPVDCRTVPSDIRSSTEPPLPPVTDTAVPSGFGSVVDWPPTVDRTTSGPVSVWPTDTTSLSFTHAAPTASPVAACTRTGDPSPVGVRSPLRTIAIT